MKPFRWLGLLGASLLLAGCETTRQPGLTFTGDPLRDGHQAIESGPAKDKVLWQYRTAAFSMWEGRYGEAHSLCGPCTDWMGMRWDWGFEIAVNAVMGDRSQPSAPPPLT